MKLTQKNIEEAMPDNNHGPLCFDLSAARQVVDGSRPHIGRSLDGDICYLDLSGFSSYTHEGLEFLVAHLPAGGFPVVTLGFRTLTPEGARALFRLEAETIELDALIRLDADVATELHSSGELELPYVVGIRVDQPLDAVAAERLLLARQDSLLPLSLPSISPEVAAVLRRHNHECLLDIRDAPLSPMVAECLAHHDGYSLLIDLNEEPEPMVLQALASNPEMPLVNIGRKTRPGFYYSISLPFYVEPRIADAIKLVPPASPESHPPSSFHASRTLP